MSFWSTTEICQKEEAQLNGRKVVVVDTPGFFPTIGLQKDIVAEVSKGVKFCSPGPHVILHVMPLSYFIRKEMEVIQLIKEVFGFKAKNYIILLFTHKDHLKGRSLEQFISAKAEDLKEYIAECGNRMLAFNNEAEEEEREAQVAKLMAMIDDLAERNRNAPSYT
ncbi:GTPase IMAP family member 9-like [Thamnophis elegans]|uniref:GTPase IMAP family member 9-like n=1 Tax=Thamnophis elegans TaxID=35005 RepID=UPI001378DC5F|nr:GTPase IMAP family member 9-like [Thamnophis elegans]